ncbi:MAG: hypothetical protein WBD27_18955 [Pyrinomonadaceae bacterium]
MDSKITIEEANRLGMEQGAFVSLDTLVREHGVSLKTKSRIISEFFKQLSTQVAEAERETEYVRHALQRLKHTCHRGAQQDTFGRPALEKLLLEDFHRDLWILDGWTVSLLETDLTLVGFVSPQLARNKVDQINVAMSRLFKGRKELLSWNAKAPSLFEDYFK